MEQVFLAEQLRAPISKGLLSSKFVIAILTDEETNEAACEKAEEFASKHNARIVAPYDGDSFYDVVHAEAKFAAHADLLAIMAAIIYTRTDNDGDAVEKAQAILKILESKKS